MLQFVQMTDKKKIIKLVLISTLTALPFFYFGNVVGFAALMLAVGFCLRSGLLSGAWKNVFWAFFITAGFMSMSWAILPLTLVAFLLDRVSPASVASPDYSFGAVGPEYYADRPGRLDLNAGTIFSPLEDDELDGGRI